MPSSRWSQLSKKAMRRTFASYGYLGSLAALVIVLNAVNTSYDSAHPDGVIEVVFLVLAAALMTLPNVRIDQGSLSLVGVGLFGAALLLNPLNATIIGVSSSAAYGRRGRFQILGNATICAAQSCLGATVAGHLRSGPGLTLGTRLLVLLICATADVLLVAIALQMRTGAPIAKVIAANVTPSFGFAFAYFALAALLVSYVLDGSPTGLSLIHI